MRGTRDTPWPFPDHRTECRIPAFGEGPYGCRRFAWNAVTARRIRSVRTSDRNTAGRATLFMTSPSVEYTGPWPGFAAGAAFSVFAFVTFAGAAFFRRPRRAFGTSVGADSSGAARLLFSGSALGLTLPASIDRKSTRLNSSHGYISYAVFC